MDYAQGELGLLPDQLWDMSWADYRRYAKGYAMRQDREWERTRLLATQMVNLVSEKPVTPQQYMWLNTDPQEPDNGGQEPKESQEDFWKRMSENNFFQRPPAPAPDAE